VSDSEGNRRVFCSWWGYHTIEDLKPRTPDNRRETPVHTSEGFLHPEPALVSKVQERPITVNRCSLHLPASQCLLAFAWSGSSNPTPIK
jgi:hypothetical protein